MGLGLAEIRFREGIPRFAVAPAAEKIERRGSVLVLGTLPEEPARELRREEVEILWVKTPQQALESLSSIAFRAIILSPEVAGAIDLVKQVKQGKDASDTELVWEAASRNMLTPIVVLPFAGEDQYAVIVVPPEIAFLERTGNVPLSHVLLRLDVEALVRRSPPRN